MKKVFRIILFAIIVIFGIATISVLVKDHEPTAPNKGMAYILATQHIEARLQPAPATFPDFNTAKYDSVAPLTWKIRSFVDTKNGFNADVRRSYEVTVGWTDDHKRKPITGGFID